MSPPIPRSRHGLGGLTPAVRREGTSRRRGLVVGVACTSKDAEGQPKGTRARGPNSRGQVARGMRLAGPW